MPMPSCLFCLKLAGKVDSHLYTALFTSQLELGNVSPLYALSRIMKNAQSLVLLLKELFMAT